MNWADVTLRCRLRPNHGCIQYPMEEYKPGAVCLVLMQTLN